MELWRFLAGLALLSLASVASMFATDASFQLAISNEAITHNIGRAVGQVFGGVMFLAIFGWLPLRWFRGAEKVPDIRHFTLYGTAIIVLLFPIFRFYVGTSLSKSEQLAIPITAQAGYAWNIHHHSALSFRLCSR